MSLSQGNKRLHFTQLSNQCSLLCSKHFQAPTTMCCSFAQHNHWNCASHSLGPQGLTARTCGGCVGSHFYTFLSRGKVKESSQGHETHTQGMELGFRLILEHLESILMVTSYHLIPFMTNNT